MAPYSLLWELCATPLSISSARRWQISAAQINVLGEDFTIKNTASIGLLIPAIFLLTAEALRAQTPEIEITFVPAWGSYNSLEGEVSGVNPSDYRVAVYIYVEGFWYNKPTFADPLTPILEDSTWTCDVTTGGIDEYATRMIAFLVPEGYTPPADSFEFLPGELFQFPYDLTCRLPGNRIIQFAGCNWVVKQCEARIGPGGNYFTDDSTDVWVDGSGKLHMKIVNRGGRWYCSEVIADTILGYAQYIFRIDSRLDSLDPNVIVGLFTWDEWPPQDSAQFYQDYHYREMDIEFSRWGNPGEDENAQYVVQPWGTEGNMYRFIMSSDSESTHLFDWQAESITFQSSKGYLLPAPPEDIIESWVYTGGDIPLPGKENPRINCWLLAGQEPLNGQEVEIVFAWFGDSLAVGRAEPSSQPGCYQFYPAHPNPFNQQTALTFAMPKPGEMSLGIFDLQGREISRLLDRRLPAGEHKVIFNAASLPSGLYFARLAAVEVRQTQKLLLLR